MHPAKDPRRLWSPVCFHVICTMGRAGPKSSLGFFHFFVVVFCGKRWNQWRIWGISRNSSWDPSMSVAQQLGFIPRMEMNHRLVSIPHCVSFIWRREAVSVEDAWVFCVFYIEMLACYRRRTIWALAAENISGAAFGAGGGGMLHIGCECWDGTSPHSHSSQMPLYSVPPPFIPPPLSSCSNKWSFCSSVFAVVGWQAPAGPKPQDYWTLLKLFFSCTL